MDLVLVARSRNVAVIRLNRPQALNALSSSLIDQLLSAITAFDRDPEIGAIVLTGNDHVFCAGADIKELRDLSFVKAYSTNFLKSLNDAIASIRKPIIGVVNGFALGGGCELAMMCDVLYAGESAKFGQPEVKVGTIPGAGGTQRLIRAIGKAKAMHMILTGEVFTAEEAAAAGLVAKVLPDNVVLNTAIEYASKIASYSGPIVAMAKEAVNQAENLSLESGLRYESRMYHATFSTEDTKEGFAAFIEKRPAVWKGS